MTLIEGRKNEAVDDYAEAAALAVANRERFPFDSSSQQLDFLGTLSFQPKIVRDASQIIDRAEKQLDALVGAASLLRASLSVS